MFFPVRSFTVLTASNNCERDETDSTVKTDKLLKERLCGYGMSVCDKRRGDTGADFQQNKILFDKRQKRIHRVEQYLFCCEKSALVSPTAPVNRPEN